MSKLRIGRIRCQAVKSPGLWKGKRGKMEIGDGAGVNGYAFGLPYEESQCKLLRGSGKPGKKENIASTLIPPIPNSHSSLCIFCRQAGKFLIALAIEGSPAARTRVQRREP
ncbi:hypothetical protein BaRGS_00010834, partial [Batillaria attramentaria]